MNKLTSALIKNASSVLKRHPTNFSSLIKFTTNVRNQSSSSKQMLFIEDNRANGYVTLKLDRAPVNSLSLEFLTELNIQMEKIEQSKEYNGVVITSNLGNIFSAGLDINEMYQSTPERCSQFWSALQEFWIKLYGSNKCFIAAINGHAPAGGCLIAMSCDYRIMAKGSYKIGLNETLLGITAPFWFRDTMINTIGFRESEKALQLGKLYSPEEALNVKLVDELAEPGELTQKVDAQMKKWLKIPTMARELTKSSMRRNTISKLLARREEDTASFVDYTRKEFIQKSLKMYLESMQKKTKK